jgi:hypothetical protein
MASPVAQPAPTPSSVVDQLVRKVKDRARAIVRLSIEERIKLLAQLRQRQIHRSQDLVFRAR